MYNVILILTQHKYLLQKSVHLKHIVYHRILKFIFTK